MCVSVVDVCEDELNDTRFIFNIEADISNNSDTDDDINDL